MKNEVSLTQGFRFGTFHRRCCQSLLQVVVLLPAIVVIATILLKVDPSSPWKCLELWHMLTSLSSWLYLCILTFCVVAMTSFHIHNYTVIHDVIATKWNILWRLVKPTHVLGFSIFVIITAVSVRCYSGLLDDSTSHLLLPADAHTYCFNEKHSFVVLHGVYTGLLYGIAYYLYRKNEIEFPIIQQSKHLQIKLVLPKNFLTAFINVFHKIKWYYLLFFVFGSYTKTFIMSLVNVDKSCQATSLDSITGLLDLSLFWTTWLTASVVCFTWDTSIYFFQLCITKRHVFEIDAGSAETGNISLHHTLMAKDVPLLQYLGYLDLALLSQSSVLRRKQLYSLSHPGGHPYNWKFVVNECLTLLQNLTMDLNTCNTEIGADLMEPIDSKKLLESQKIMNIAPLHCSHLIQSPSASEKVTQPTRVPPIVIIRDWVKRKKLAVCLDFRTWLAKFHLFRMSNKNSCRFLFANCQIHVWAIQAVSFLAAFSIREDKYGVVQQDLTDIFVTLCDLLQAVEKKQKWIMRVTKLIPTHWDLRGLKVLSTEVKTASYRLATTFRPHLDGLELMPEYEKMVRQFAGYE